MQQPLNDRAESYAQFQINGINLMILMALKML